MNRCRVIILGGNGFVGRNFVEVFRNKKTVEILSTSKKPSQGQVYFDILEQSSWQGVIDTKPDFIIDATGYGVVRDQIDLDLLYKINYSVKTAFIDYMYKHLSTVFWIQIGTAFEYDLNQERLTEESFCFPKTHYGISKALFSSYLTEKIRQRYCIVRPFGMFGEGEAISKFFPMLISAQKQRKIVNLSEGEQRRDYFYVKDLGEFLHHLIAKNQINKLERQIINIGSGVPKSLKSFSEILAGQIPDFNSRFWAWGIVPKRDGENNLFYNSSLKASQLGFVTTPLEIAFQKTVAFYYQHGTDFNTV